MPDSPPLPLREGQGDGATRDELAGVRARLAGPGRLVVGARQIGAVNNNRLLRLEVDGGPPLLAKLYYRDTRRRLEREYDALAHLAERDFPNVPRPIARDDAAYSAVYTFESGTTRPPEELTAADVRALAHLAADLHRIPVSGALGQGHCTIGMIANAESYLAHAPDALRREIEPVLALAPDYTPPPRERLRLNHGDFAPHNVLFDGPSLCVVDWEVAGWDDPACLVLDFVVHEATRGLPRAHANLFLDTYLAGHPGVDLAHWRDVYQLLQVSWTLGFLSAFNPAYLDRKRFANADLDVAAFQAGQVAKLRARLERVVDSPPDPLIS